MKESEEQNVASECPFFISAETKGKYILVSSKIKLNLVIEYYYLILACFDCSEFRMK